MAELVLEAVEQRARTALERSPVYALRELQVEVHPDRLLLSGRVDSFYHKQLAQEVVRGVVDGMQVENAVQVGG